MITGEAKRKLDLGVEAEEALLGLFEVLKCQRVDTSRFQDSPFVDGLDGVTGKHAENLAMSLIFYCEALAMRAELSAELRGTQVPTCVKQIRSLAALISKYANSIDSEPLPTVRAKYFHLK
jgi:hypothetical protein